MFEPWTFNCAQSCDGLSSCIFFIDGEDKRVRVGWECVLQGTRSIRIEGGLARMTFVLKGPVRRLLNHSLNMAVTMLKAYESRHLNFGADTHAQGSLFIVLEHTQR